MIIRKKIKFNNKQYNINVYSYYNGRMRIKLENKVESHDLTINLEDVYLNDGDVFLDPITLNNGIINILKKKRIIREVKGFTNYNYVEIPVVKVNMGKLREYDSIGVRKHLDERAVFYSK